MTTMTDSRPTARRSPMRDVQKRICGYERTIDDGLEGAAEMLRGMMVVSREAGLAPAEGQEALDAVEACIVTNIALRRQAIEAHRRLRAAADRIDLEVTGWGALPPSPDQLRELAGRARQDASA